MAKRLSYADAVALLGGPSPAVARLDRALGGALLVGAVAGAAPLVNLFDAKGEVTRVGHGMLLGLRDRIKGLRRFDRTQRLHAAHAVIVVTAYFEALDVQGLPFSLTEVELTRHDEVRLAAGDGGEGGWLADLLTTDAPMPSPDVPYETTLDQIRRWYADLSQRFLTYLGGLALWDRLDDTAQTTVMGVLRDLLPPRAVGRYEILHRKLTVDIPEFAVWVQRSDDQATRVELRQVRQGLRDLETLLTVLTSGQHLGQRSAALAAAYRAELDEPILGSSGTAQHLRMPTLSEIYIDPWFRVRAAGRGDRPSDEDWWADLTSRDDLPGFLASYLTTAQACEAPLVVLGQPGAGKSALTRVIAARLPPSDFLPVRVPLRDVPAELELQDQIEHALRAATGHHTSWPDLARLADGALPLVLLDGFDELLQATGVSQSDFLERVAAFQRREAVQQRPVAVLVTSRTAVADRARMPEDTMVVRLEPFTADQVDRWLEVWNQANAASFHTNGLQPFPPRVAHRYQDLASQPLLLLMLALYDAQANEVQT